jgi:hypothetical protein
MPWLGFKVSVDIFPGDRNNLDAQLLNPCDIPMLKKLFRPGKLARWQIHEKETIDEIIFRTIFNQSLQTFGQDHRRYL